MSQAATTPVCRELAREHPDITLSLCIEQLAKGDTNRLGKLLGELALTHT